MAGTIIQWNCRSFRQSRDELIYLTSRLSPAVLCLQETKLGPSDLAVIKCYSVYRRDIQSNTINHGGVAVAVHHGVPCSALPLQTQLQAVAVRVNLLQFFVTVCSVYLPPSDEVRSTDLENLLDQLPQPFLLLGDFNAHNPIWGSLRQDQRGRQIERILISNNVSLLNSGSHTHFSVTPHSTSAIDLSLCSPDLLHRFEWHVDDDPLSSDHFPIIIKMIGNVSLGNRPPMWKIHEADWELFAELATFESPAEESDVNQVLLEFTSRILQAA